MTRVAAWARRQITAHQAVLADAAAGWAESLLIALADPRTAGRPAHQTVMVHRTVMVLGVAS